MLLTNFLKTRGAEFPKVGILDLGAMLLGNENEKDYVKLLQYDHVSVIGFEPVQAECDKLNQQINNPNCRYLPYFIGDGTEQTFYETTYPMSSSLYEPNVEFLDIYVNLANFFEIKETHQVQTKRLDDIPEIDIPIDYIKMDIQGAELQALESAKDKVLKNTSVIRTEIEWVEMYKGQPLFSEIELFLREQGFMVHKLEPVCERPIKPFMFDELAKTGPQSLWSDVIFVRDITKLDQLPSEMVLKMAVILYDLYKSIDLVYYVLNKHDDVHGTTYGKALHKHIFKK